MSAAPGERHEVGDLDPAGVLAEAKASDGVPQDQVTASGSPTSGRSCTPPPPTPESRPPAARVRRAGCRRDPRRRRDPTGRRLRPRGPRGGHGLVTRRGPQPDGRRPRPGPPPPQALEARTPRPGPRLAGPPCRPADPTPPPGGCPVGRRQARRTGSAAAPSSPTGSSPKPPPSSTPKNTRAAKTAAGSSDVKLTHPHPASSPAPANCRPRRHPALQAFYDLVCAIAHQLLPRRRHRPPRRSQGQSPRRHRRPHRTGHLTSPTAAGTARQVQGLRPRRGHRPRPTTSAPSEKLGAATIAKIRLGRPPPGHHPTRPQQPRRDAVDPTTHHPGCESSSSSATATASSPAAPATPRSCDLDHIHPLRPRRPTRPDPPRQPRLPLQTTPPRQDQRTLALHPHARRHLPLARAIRHHVTVTR